MKRKLIIILTLFVFGFQSQAQQKEQKAAPPNNQGFLFTPHWAYQKVGGDLKDRFYDFTSIGISIDYKTKKNLQFGLDYDWYYGRHVKDTGLFNGIDGQSGQVIDKNGNFSVIRLSVKGNYVTANLSYVYPIIKSHENSGILLKLGAGVMQHKIDIFSSQVTIPQINGEYEKGYDRLTYGFAVKEFIGYQFLINRNKFHFRTGVEFNQGFTKGRRTWDFSSNSPGTGKRYDSTIAFKFGIIVPVFTKSSEDEEFFYD